VDWRAGAGAGAGAVARRMHPRFNELVDLNPRLLKRFLTRPRSTYGLTARLGLVNLNQRRTNMNGSTFESWMLAALGLDRDESWRAVLAKSIKRRIARVRENRRLRRDLDILLALDDRQLADIGLGRSELEYAARHGRRFSDTSANGDR
jgi:uncharacterized protein YjiS (DUF1127 family)